jgi:hypothetical protein
MLSSIHPLGERAKGQRWAVTAGAHVVGAVLGGALVGLASWTAGIPLRAVLGDPARIAVVLVAALAATVVEARPSWSVPLPGLRRQVDERWLTAYRGWVYGFGFGLQLGAAVLTFVRSAAIPLALLAAGLVGPWWAALAVGSTFGAVRGLSLLAAAGVTDGDRLRALHQRVEGFGAKARTGGVVALGAVTFVTGGALAAGWA